MPAPRSSNAVRRASGVPLAVEVLVPVALIAALAAVAAALLAGAGGSRATEAELDARAAMARAAWRAAGAPTGRTALRELGTRLDARLSVETRRPQPQPRTEGDFRVREFRAPRGRALTVAVRARPASDTVRDGLMAGIAVAAGGVLALVALGWLLLGRAATRPLRDLAGAMTGIAAGRQDARVLPGGSAEVRRAGIAFNDFAGQVAELSRPGGDPVTGLPPAKQFRESLGVEVHRALREQYPMALVVIDLDDFRRVNDQHGKEAGDEFLRQVGEALRSALRATDILGRIGGDEFGMLLPKANSQQAQMVIDRSREAVAEIEGAELGFCAGYACYPTDAREPPQLLQAAEGALRAAVAAGPGTARRFDPGTIAVTRNEGERAEVEAILEDPEAIMPVFQPLVALATGQISGYESLTRFRQPPERRPDEWFLLAQRVGLGPTLEAHAIKLALETPRRPAGTYLSLNLSPSTLDAPPVQAVLPQDLTGLVVEVTEHELAADEGALQADLARMRERGARIAVDDAGAGYAGLQQLMRVQPDLIKLDRSLVQDVDGDPAKQALVDAFVRFGRRTGAWVVAEGIETEEELRTLADLDVTYGQGYFLARPGPAWPEVSPWVSEKLLRHSLAGATSVEEIPMLPIGSDQRLAAVCARVAAVGALSELEALSPTIADELDADEVVVMLGANGEGALTAVGSPTWLVDGRMDLGHFQGLQHALVRGEPVQFLAGRGSGTTAGIGEIALLASSGYSSLLAIPVTDRGELVGALLALARQERPWGRTQTNRGFVIAYQLGPVLAGLAPERSAQAEA